MTNRKLNTNNYNIFIYIIVSCMNESVKEFLDKKNYTIPCNKIIFIE